MFGAKVVQMTAVAGEKLRVGDPVRLGPSDRVYLADCDEAGHMEQAEKDRPALEIEVTQAMIDAGLCELREHHLGDDLGYMVESVYRAMAYAR